MHKVASDSAVMRPLRAEPAPGRAGASGARKDFETLLDTPKDSKTETPRPARTERANRNNDTRPADDRRAARAEVSRAR